MPLITSEKITQIKEWEGELPTNSLTLFKEILKFEKQYLRSPKKDSIDPHEKRLAEAKTKIKKFYRENKIDLEKVGKQFLTDLNIKKKLTIDELFALVAKN